MRDTRESITLLGVTFNSPFWFDVYATQRLNTSRNRYWLYAFDTPTVREVTTTGPVIESTKL